METKKYSVYNPSTESYLSSGVTVINTRLEPLKVLRVMIDGLALNAETGLLLTPFDGIPQVPRLSPFDLVYLDSEARILQGAELLPGAGTIPYVGRAASALVLPYKTLSSSKSLPGHQLRVQIVEEPQTKPEPAVEQEASPPGTEEAEAAPVLEGMEPGPHPEAAVRAEPPPAVAAEPEAPVVAESEPAVVAQPEPAVAAESEAPVAAEREIPVLAEPEPAVAAEPATPVAAQTEPEPPVAAQPETPAVAERESPFPYEAAAVPAEIPVPKRRQPRQKQYRWPKPAQTPQPAEPPIVSTSQSEEQKESTAAEAQQPPTVEVLPGLWAEVASPLESASPSLVEKEEAEPASQAPEVVVPKAEIPPAEPEPEPPKVEIAAAPVPASLPHVEVEEPRKDSPVAPSPVASPPVAPSPVVPSAVAPSPVAPSPVVPPKEAEAEVPSAATEEVPNARQGQETETPAPAPAHVPEPSPEPTREPIPEPTPEPTPIFAPAELPQRAPALISTPPVPPPQAPREAPMEKPAPETSPVVQAVPKAPPAKPQAAPVAKQGLKPAKEEPGAAPESSSKEAAVVRFLRWLDPTLITMPERRRNLRRRMPALTAYRWINGVPMQYRIGNISSTGIYLYTEDHLPAGELVTLSLQAAGPPEKAPERRVALKAKVVRRGENGVGLRFVLPAGMDLRLWESETKAETDNRKPEYVVNEIRMAKALAFVGRICPPVSKGVEQLLKKELSTYRIANALEIALRAEELVAREQNGAGMRAHPAVVLRVLESGSWSEYEFVRVSWAGLLATACTAEGNDESNLPFVDMLSLMTSMHLRVLLEACAQANKLTSTGGQLAANALYFNHDELMKIAGSNDMTKIDRSIGLLGEMKLIVTTPRSHFYGFHEEIMATPTRLGLEMVARCNGHRFAQ